MSSTEKVECSLTVKNISTHVQKLLKQDAINKPLIPDFKTTKKHTVKITSSKVFMIPKKEYNLLFPNPLTTC